MIPPTTGTLFFTSMFIHNYKPGTDYIYAVELPICRVHSCVGYPLSHLMRVDDDGWHS